MKVAVAGLDPTICLVFLDDIIVHSRNLSAHLDRLRLLFDRLLVTDRKLKVSKCRLLRTEMGFHGHRISKKGLDPERGKIDAVREWPTPAVLQMCGPSSASVLTIGSFWEVLATLPLPSTH